MKPFSLTQAKVDTIRETIRPGLSSGLGQPIPGEMCVEAAICYSLGLPHGDDPGCVDQSLRAFKIALNDSAIWSSKEARAKGLERLAIAQLGTHNWTIEQQRFFIEELICLSIKWAKSVFKETKDNKENFATWTIWADNYLANNNRNNTKAARAVWAAKAAAEAAAKAAEAAEFAESAKAAARAAAWAAWAAETAAWAAWAAEVVAKAVARVAEAVARVVKDNDDKDKVLSNCAEDVVQLLLRMDTEGSRWL